MSDYDEADPSFMDCTCKGGHARCYSLDCPCPQHPRLDLAGIY